MHRACKDQTRFSRRLPPREFCDRSKPRLSVGGRCAGARLFVRAGSGSRNVSRRNQYSFRGSLLAAKSWSTYHNGDGGRHKQDIPNRFLSPYAARSTVSSMILAEEGSPLSPASMVHTTYDFELATACEGQTRSNTRLVLGCVASYMVYPWRGGMDLEKSSCLVCVRPRTRRKSALESRNDPGH